MPLPGRAATADLSPADALPAPERPIPAFPPTTLADLATRLADRTATIGVVGLGYVGLPLLVTAGDAGYGVVGVDVDGAKVRTLRGGHSYVGDVVDDEVLALTAIGRASFDTDHTVLAGADVVVIAVPTPLRDGGPDLSMVRAAAENVARVLRPGQLVVLESTTYPGTTEELVRPILETSGLVAGKDFALAFSPERIDPGTGRSVRATPKIVAGLGPDDTELAAAFYGSLVDTVVRCSSPRNAEMAKLIENTFRQVNIALVNELATIAPAIGVDIWEALDAAATKPFGYLPFWPGAGVGGHCIAIDPSYLSWKVEQRLGFGIGFIEHARSVNNRMPAYVAGRIAEALNGAGKALRGARIVVLGLAYKPGVDDVRESAPLRVLHHLLDAGADCVYHDEYVASVNVSRRRAGDHGRAAPVPGDDGERVLRSVPLTDDLLAGADCVVILTAHPGVDHAAVAAASSLVFDATGTTRFTRSENVVLI
ncbi:MAG TPA: nucleotide sugar dehydrogenase [Acidimicrobiales bacterium]|nr:nucleotide sugar dehydrogenase [Acidimicrobiales bacterium]